MTLIEAIKSGRPVRDPASTEDDYRFWHSPVDHMYPAYMVTSTTWEIQEPAVTITRTQFWDACETADKAAPLQLPRLVWTQELARKLGLEP